jgi:hypothetical protein
MVTGALVQTKQHGLPARGVGDHQPRTTAATDVLSDFVRRSEPWSRQRVSLPGRLRRSLWILIPIDLIWGIWLWTITTGATACDGPICTVATLNDHPAVLLALAAMCVAGLAGLAPITRGFSRCGGREVAGVGMAAAAGATALLGVATLLIGALIILVMLAALIVAFTATA